MFDRLSTNISVIYSSVEVTRKKNLRYLTHYYKIDKKELG